MTAVSDTEVLFSPDLATAVSDSQVLSSSGLATAASDSQVLSPADLATAADDMEVLSPAGPVTAAGDLEMASDVATAGDMTAVDNSDSQCFNHFAENIKLILYAFIALIALDKASANILFFV